MVLKYTFVLISSYLFIAILCAKMSRVNKALSRIKINFFWMGDNFDEFLRGYSNLYPYRGFPSSLEVILFEVVPIIYFQS
jgi:hypothetical protein